MTAPGLIAKVGKLVRVLSAGESSFVKSLRYGVVAGVEHEAMLRRLAARTVVDIGANHGQFALIARHCFPEARIVAFEPLVGPAERFRRVFAADRNVTLYEAAIGPDDRSAEIHISARDDSSSLLPITKAQVQIFPGTGEVGQAMVEVKTLSNFLATQDIVSPALLKLDVQGYELEALRGCEVLLSNFDDLYCECSFIELYGGQALAGDVIGWLRERQWDLASIYNASYDRNGLAIQADFLFKRRKVDTGPSKARES